MLDRVGQTGATTLAAAACTAACAFEGSAESVRVDGRGPAVLLEDPPFRREHGAVEVEFAGAYTRHFQPLGDLVVHAPERIEPLGMARHGVTYTATYQAGPKLEVRIAYGRGDADGAIFDESGHIGGVSEVCPIADGWCNLIWRTNNRVVRLERAGDEPALLVEQLPVGRGRLDRVVLEDARGSLECAGDSAGVHTFENGETLTWGPGSGSLAMAQLTLTGDRLQVVVCDQREPAVTSPVSATAVPVTVPESPPRQTPANASAVLMGIGIALAVLAVALVAAVLRRLRRRPLTTGAPAPASAIPRSELDQLVELLVACHSLMSFDDRKRMLARLDGLHDRIPDTPGARDHLIDIVVICAAHPGGLLALREAVYYVEGGTYQMRAVDEWLTQVGLTAQHGASDE
ncbi:effector-associated domain 2-containing protein [Haliangium sp.]|uniref:effector-associated domain 2-containing protein n=1 Tax=Haliangium sp. TaxID=2663208 RepID=UPI003D14A25C